MNWHSSSWPAGGTVKQQQQQQHMLLFILFSESRAAISSLEKYYLFARIKGSVMLLFVSFTECLTCNFSLKTRGSDPSPLLFLYCPSIKGLIPNCPGVKTCFSATHTHLWPNPGPSTNSLATMHLQWRKFSSWLRSSEYNEVSL